MKRFQSFIKESQESHVILTFGRFNPPTCGHDLVLNKVYNLAEQYNAPYHVYLSRTHDKSKNPLDPDTKLHFVNKCFPECNAKLTTPEYPGIIQLAEQVQDNHTHLHVVAGQDRVQEYQTLLNRYNGGRYKYENITVHSAGDRIPTNEGIQGISASRMREYAKNGDYDSFSSCCPYETTREISEQLFHAVRKGLSIKEEKQGKALFVTGGPGSGKDIILRPLLQMGVVECPVEKLMDDMQGSAVRLLEAKTPIIVNGTFKNESVFTWCKAFLESFNYQVGMVYVYTSDHESKSRNQSRQGVGRVINESARHEKWMQSTNMTPVYHKLLGENFCVFDNETIENVNIQMPVIIPKLKEFLFGADINEAFEQFLPELFQHGYPIVPDDQKPLNRNIPTVGKKKGKPLNSKTFQSSVDRNNSVPGNGIGYDFSIRGSEGSAPSGGIGDPSYRESVQYSLNKRQNEELDGSMSMIGGGSNSEPMATPGEKVVDQMTATGGTTNNKKKTFRDLRKYAK